MKSILSQVIQQEALTRLLMGKGISNEVWCPDLLGTRMAKY
jgi:hypothetical protein